MSDALRVFIVDDEAPSSPWMTAATQPVRSHPLRHWNTTGLSLEAISFSTLPTLERLDELVTYWRYMACFWASVLELGL